MFTLWFWISASLAIAGLGVTYRAGRQRRRRLHVGMAIASMATLAVAVVLTELMARERDFPPEAMRVHLVFAKAAGFAVFPVVVTGVLLLRRPRVRRWHLRAVWLFLLLAVAATVTGGYAFTGSVPR